MDETSRNFDESTCSSILPSMEISQEQDDDTVNHEVNEICLNPCPEFCGEPTDLLGPKEDLENQPESKCLNTTVTVGIGMEKIVNDVKTRIREKKKKNMQKNECGGKPCENGSFCLNSLFGESSFPCKEITVKKKAGMRSAKNISTSDQSDTELFGFQLLFEETETNNKRKKKKTAKVKRVKADKTTERETFGLEWLFNENKSKKSRKKRKMRENDYEENEDGKEIPLVKKKKPNYFVAIRVSNPQIHVMANDFQASVLKENDKLKPAFIPLPSLHLTMAVLFLDEITVEIAKSSLAKCTSNIIDILKSIDFKLKFQGVGNFQHEVVFAKIEEGKQLESLQAINSVITSAFENEGIIVDNKKEWKAHLTLLKLSRKPKLRRKGIKKINEEIYAAWNDSYFGEELVTSISLCSMFEPKEKDGFYKCIETISLGEANEKTSESETQDLMIQYQNKL